MSFLKPTIGTSSPTPSNASSAGPSSKRKRIDVPVSPPAQKNTQGVLDLREHVFQAVEHLHRNPTQAFARKEISDYVSLFNKEMKKSMFSALQWHGSVEYDPEGRTTSDGKKIPTYKYKPKYAVKSEDDLKGLLQRQTSSLGVSVKDLKDGWPDAVAAITKMEADGDLLVMRNTKDRVPKTVWINDPTLSTSIDTEFKMQWHTIPLPANADDLRTKLQQAGIKPTSAPKQNVQNMKPKEKKKRAQRKSGRQTNSHMASILKDYSHKRK